MTSAQTILSDNPKLNVRLGAEPIAKNLAIIDTHLRLTGQEQCFETAQQLFIFHDMSKTPNWSKKNVVFYAMDRDGLGLNLIKVCKKLAILGVHDIWLEAGPTLMSAMHQQGLIHKTHIFLTPHLLSFEALDAFKPEYNYFSPSSFQLQIQQMGDNILTTFTWQDE